MRLDLVNIADSVAFITEVERNGRFPWNPILWLTGTSLGGGHGGWVFSGSRRTFLNTIARSMGSFNLSKVIMEELI